MNVEIPLRVCGDLLATTPRAIASALVPLFPTARLEISTEVRIETDPVSIEIYPDRNAPEGGNDFLLTGNIWLGGDEANEVVDRITSALAHANIAYSMELYREREAIQRPQLTNDRYAFVIGTRQAARKVSSNDEWSLDDGRIVIGDRLRSGSSEEVRAGWLRSDGAARLLVTLTGKHADPYSVLRQSFGIEIDGVAPLEFLGAATGTHYHDALVERIAGEGANPPVDIAEVCRLGADLAITIARVHATGRWLGGIRPELVFIGEQGAVLAPRGPRFIATTPLARGIRSYAVPYLSPEELMSSRGGPASDVFSLCATLFYFGTGQHPFGDVTQISALAARLSMGAPDVWPEGGALADILAVGMRIVADERPTAHQLADLLARLS